MAVRLHLFLDTVSRTVVSGEPWIAWRWVVSDEVSHSNRESIHGESILFCLHLMILSHDKQISGCVTNGPRNGLRSSFRLKSFEEDLSAKYAIIIGS